MLPLVASTYATLLTLAVSGGLDAPRSSAEAAARLARAAEVPSLNSEAPLDLRTLGSLSLGEPNHGRLMNGVRLDASSLFELVTPQFAWGTEETVASLRRAAQTVHSRFPHTPPLHVGHISAASGGHLAPHKSHQSGRDVDLGFYYSGERVWYRRGTPQNLDLPRTWALIRALIVETDVEFVLVDRSLHAPLRQEALRQGDDPAWLDSVFRGKGPLPALVRHARGHATHLHVRFFSPQARRAAARAYPVLLERKLIEPVQAFTYYRARNGDTLGKLSHRFGVSVDELKRANALRTSAIRAGRTYRIPQVGRVATPSDFVCPPRRLPERAGHGASAPGSSATDGHAPGGDEDDSLLDSEE
ncbi:MAG TPA: penicillin-insensitive murein endopeptidase [Polyangiaceae bacterium]|nr:penicillin-insensitive murein endopeptidase [Polyangiaceae bacterium]